MADENKCNCECNCNEEENTSSNSYCGEEKEPYFSKANFKYFIDKLRGKIALAVGVIRFNTQDPLHIEKEPTVDGVTFNGYIDEATTSKAGLMSADDKAWFDQFSIVGSEDSPVKVEVTNNGNGKVKGPKYTIAITIPDASETEAGLMTSEDKKQLLALENSAGIYWERYKEENVNALPVADGVSISDVSWAEFKWTYDKSKVVEPTQAKAEGEESTEEFTPQTLADSDNTAEIAEGKMFFPLAGKGVPGLMTSEQSENLTTLWDAFGNEGNLASYLMEHPELAFTEVGVCGDAGSAGFFVDTLKHFLTRDLTDVTPEGVWFVYQDKFYVMALNEDKLPFSDDNGINASIGTIPNTKEAFYSEIHDGRKICKEHIDDGAWACNAIKYCNEYSTKSTNAGSWWLPSVSEIRNMMRLFPQLNVVLNVINYRMGANVATTLTESANYLSCNTLNPSDNYPDGLAVASVLSSGWIGGVYLNNNLYVRPITLLHTGDLTEIATTVEYQQPVIAVVYPDAEAEGGSVEPTVAYSQPYKDSDGNSGAITSGGELNFEEA